MHIFVLLAQAFLLNVVIPLHTPGSVVLPGTKQAEARFHLPSCCCATPDTAGSDHHTPTPYERDHCAICHIAAHTMPFVVVDFEHPFLKRHEAAAIPKPAARVIAPLIRPDHCRGPPADLV